MSEQELWEEAAKRGLPRFRFLRRSASIADLDELFRGTRLQPRWEQLKVTLEVGDRIWPFRLNVRPYLGYREGYVILRKGKPIGGIVTVVS